MKYFLRINEVRVYDEDTVYKGGKLIVLDQDSLIKIIDIYTRNVSL